MDAGDENKPEVLLVFQVLLVFLFHLGDGRHAFLRHTPQSTIVSHYFGELAQLPDCLRVGAGCLQRKTGPSFAVNSFRKRCSTAERFLPFRIGALPPRLGSVVRIAAVGPTKVEGPNRSSSVTSSAKTSAMRVIAWRTLLSTSSLLATS